MNSSSPSFISNKPSHPSVACLPSGYPAKCGFFCNPPEPGRRAVTPIIQKGKLRHRKTQHHCMKAGLESGLPPSLGKMSPSLLQLCLPRWVGEHSSVLLKQPGGTNAAAVPHAEVIVTGSASSPGCEGRDLVDHLYPLLSSGVLTLSW